MMLTFPRDCLVAAALLGVSAGAYAEHDIEFVAEHLPEVAMDNRYATLPVWDLGARAEASQYHLQAAYSSASAGNLRIDGPLLSAALHRPLGTARWGFFGFYDSLRLDASTDSRPLQTLFAPTTPIERPVAAIFSNLDGTTTDMGAGLFWSRGGRNGFLGDYRWNVGALWQQVKLQDYRFDYVIDSGPQQGLQGQIDFDASYAHIAPFAGIELPRGHGDWIYTPHALIAYPLPRRGFVGHITGPGFDISGDTADVGAGKHFGDPSVTLGLTVTYVPARFSIDLGTLVSQALLERRIHKGIEQNVVLSFTWSP